MVSSSKRFLLCALAALALSLCACHRAAKLAPPPPPPPPVEVKPTVAKATLVVARNVNPDIEGRASPIVLRLYQLKDQGAFSNADFFALYDREQETLGASVLAREEYQLQPGQTLELQFKVVPDARFIAAIAGYYDINHAHWKAVSTAPQEDLTDLLRENRVTLDVARSELKLSIGK